MSNMSLHPESLVDRIYQAALFPEEWSPTLHEIERLVDGVGASLLTRRNDAWTGWRVSPSAAPHVERYLASRAPTASRTTEKLIAFNHCGFVADHQVMTDEEYLADPLVADYGVKVGWHRAAATAIHVPGGDFAVTQVWRRAGLPRFSPTDLAGLDAIRPHLARSAMLAARWKLERLRAAAQALELLGIPGAILDAAGRVLAANRLIQEMTGHVIWLAANRVALRDAGAAAILRRACQRAWSTNTATGRSFAARAADGSEPVVVHIVPVKGDGRELFDGGLILLAMNQVGARAPDSELLQGLFDLTAAEARVAAGLLDGLTVSDLSRRDKVSVATVRSQVHALLGKAGVRRQSEFIAKLRGAPVGPRA